MSYEHTQKSPLGWMLFLMGLILMVAGLTLAVDPVGAIGLPLVGIVFVLVGFCFGSLTVRDEGDALAVRYGPLPVFRKRLAYSEMTDARPGRSTLIDGWGIHWIPGRGWIYNLWGFGCVRIQMGKRTVRIGIDDVEGLAGFLRRRIEG